MILDTNALSAAADDDPGSLPISPAPIRWRFP
jgi:hypothetical protein